MTAVLALDPDRKEALDSLAAHADVMNVPKINLAGDLTPDRTADSLSALLRFGASVPGAARELAVIELGRAPRDEALQKELLAELRSKIVTRRSFAALALRRLLPGQAVKPLILHAVLDPSDEVRKDSSLALRTMNAPGVTSSRRAHPRTCAATRPRPSATRATRPRSSLSSLASPPRLPTPGAPAASRTHTSSSERRSPTSRTSTSKSRSSRPSPIRRSTRSSKAPSSTRPSPASRTATSRPRSRRRELRSSA